MLYKIAPYLPMPVRRALRQARASTEGYFSYLAALREDGEIRQYARQNNLPLPPLKARRLIGGGHFFEIGDTFLKQSIELCDLKPDESVLDVGCGYGRTAVAFTHYLSEKGRYEGFDILKDGIRWCQRNITPAHTNFQFVHSDIYHGFYNRHGRYKASEYRFPYDDASFDFVFLASVFTHLLPVDLEHYLQEISRVLRSGGRCFITYFLLNDEVRKRISKGEASIPFTKKLEGYWVTERDKEEGAVAYEQAWVCELHHKYGLPIREPIHHGKWSGVKSDITWQDIVIADKDQ
jgi:SAM-dependent methyltransferase